MIRRTWRKSYALQDAIKVAQPGGPGKFEVPNWDRASHKKVRDALMVLGETIPDWRRAAGRRNEVDPIRHLIVTATGWGLNPDKDAIYLNVTPAKNDGSTIHKLEVKDVPVDGFWSISLYDADGLLPAERLQRVYDERRHREEERRRIGHHPVRRLRRQDSELPADHAGLELHGAALSSAARNSRRHLEVPAGAARKLISSPNKRRSVCGSLAALPFALTKSVPEKSRRSAPKRQSRPADGLHSDELELEFQVHVVRSIAAGFAAATGHGVQFIVR